MSKKVQSSSTGIIHAYAQCDNCDWNSAIDIKERNRMGKLKSRIYSHVKSTEHSVTLETGNSFTYSPKL